MTYLKCDRYDIGGNHVETLYVKKFSDKFEAVDFVDKNYLVGLGMRNRKRIELCRRWKMFFSYPVGYLGELEPAGVIGFRIYSREKGCK